MKERKFTYVPYLDGPRERMAKVLPSGTSTWPILTFRALRGGLRRGGLAVSRVETLNLLNLEWAGYSQGVAGLIAAFVAGRRGITEDDASAWIDDLRRLSDAGDYFFSLDQYLFLATKPAA
jgi:hypothetical protein